MKVTFAVQTRNIKIMHPTIPELELFEAHVKIVNLNTALVDKIEGVEIKYTLKKGE